MNKRFLDKFNYFKYRFKYNYGGYLPLETPVDVSLELASACNQACPYCYHADQNKLPFTKGIMSSEIGMRIINEAARLRVNSLKFNYRGEPTLNPAFASLAIYAKWLAKDEVFIDRVVNSNFKFATKKEEIFHGLCAMTKVKVSFDSFRKEIFETQRAGGKLELALANVDKFYNYPGRTTALVIQAVRTQANKDEDLEGEIKRRWNEAIPSIRDMVEGRVDKDLSDKKLRDRGTERQSCIQAHVRLIFDYAGNAQMCCPDIGSKHQLGNIKTHGMDQIFNSVKAKQIRKALKNKKAFGMEPCKSCPSFESYKGYRAGWDS
jgi:radical SAM protein with 4Fe4S-binding SPASM domain